MDSKLEIKLADPASGLTELLQKVNLEGITLSEQEWRTMDKDLMVEFGFSMTKATILKNRLAKLFADWDNSNSPQPAAKTAVPAPETSEPAPEIAAPAPKTTEPTPELPTVNSPSITSEVSQQACYVASRNWEEIFPESSQYNQHLRRGIRAEGWNAPSKIQGYLPEIKNQHLKAQAPPGTGKTGTFMLAIFSRLERFINDQINNQPPVVMVMANSRELATGIHTTFVRFARNAELKVNVNLVIPSDSKDKKKVYAQIKDLSEDAFDRSLCPSWALLLLALWARSKVEFRPVPWTLANYKSLLLTRQTRCYQATLAMTLLASERTFKRLDGKNCRWGVSRCCSY
jgi:hypothetical protein